VLFEDPFDEDAGGDGFELGGFGAGCLFEFCAGFGVRGDQIWAGSEGCEITTNSAGLVQLETVFILIDRNNNVKEIVRQGDNDTSENERKTHNNVRDLSERLVSEVRRLFLLARSEVDHDDFVWDVTLFRDHGDATCASGKWESVKFDRHDDGGSSSRR
jgi:hypothetical protein